MSKEDLIGGKKRMEIWPTNRGKNCPWCVDHPLDICTHPSQPKSPEVLCSRLTCPKVKILKEA